MWKRWRERPLTSGSLFRLALSCRSFQVLALTTTSVCHSLEIHLRRDKLPGSTHTHTDRKKSFLTLIINLKTLSSHRVYHPASGRVLEVFTSQPGIQFYTANFLDGSVPGKGGVRYGKHSSFCLETQNWPDAVNQVWPLIRVSYESCSVERMLFFFKTLKKIFWTEPLKVCLCFWLCIYIYVHMHVCFLSAIIPRLSLTSWREISTHHWLHLHHCLIWDLTTNPMEGLVWNWNKVNKSFLDIF